MQIQHLSLTNFRNYARLELPLSADEPIVLYGANAQGKTSVLEAIYYLATSRSPYTTSDRQMIHWRTENETLPFARIEADLQSQERGKNRLEITLMLDSTSGAPRFKKVIRLNGVDRRVMDVVGVLSVVLFLPQHLALIEGSPSERRRFMDDTLTQVDSAYIDALDTFERTIPQRNALLKRIAEKRSKPAELAYWNAELARSGAVIIAGRQRLLRELEALARSNHEALTGGSETLTLQYQPNFMPAAEAGSKQRSFDLIGLDLHRQLPAEEIEMQYLAQLETEQGESIARGVTLSGPHRDELRILINNRDCGLYGSRGQARTAVLALKLAELDWMRECLGESPLLLLDDVVAELDSQRRAFLLNRLNGSAQTLITTTELDIFTEEFLNRAQVMNVVAGQIEPAASG